MESPNQFQTLSELGISVFLTDLKKINKLLLLSTNKYNLPVILHFKWTYLSLLIYAVQIIKTYVLLSKGRGRVQTK